MTKLCSVCNADNRDEAQFCRACGSAFFAATGHGSFGDEPSGENICSECGFRNKPGLRYCANCGMNLGDANADGVLEDLAPDPERVDEAASPPPVSYASFETVEPYPPAPAVPSGYPPPLDDTTPLDLPDPGAMLAIRQVEANGAPPVFLEAAPTPSPGQAKRVVTIVVAGLIVAAIAAWAFLGRESAAPPAVVAPDAIVTPAAVPPPPPVASAAAPIVVEAPTATEPASAAPAASAAVIESAPAPTAAAAEPVPSSPPSTVAPLPPSTDPIPVELSPEAEARRLAAEKARRDKAARDKAERDAKAKAKALADQRELAAAAARAEQEAQARKRAQEAQQARPVAASAAPAPVPTQPRGVRETCAGRGTIAEAVCQSRLCSAAEHANEPICRQIREADERRRNLLN